MNPLASYLAASGKSQRQFAQDIGVHHSIVSRLERNLHRPKLMLAFKIERATDGAVPASYWDSAPIRGAA